MVRHKWCLPCFALLAHATFSFDFSLWRSNWHVSWTGNQTLSGACNLMNFALPCTTFTVDCVMCIKYVYPFFTRLCKCTSHIFPPSTVFLSLQFKCDVIVTISWVWNPLWIIWPNNVNPQSLCDYADKKHLHIAVHLHAVIILAVAIRHQIQTLSSFNTHTPMLMHAVVHRGSANAIRVCTEIWLRGEITQVSHLTH